MGRGGPVSLVGACRAGAREAGVSRVECCEDGWEGCEDGREDGGCKAGGSESGEHSQGGGISFVADCKA